MVVVWNGLFLNISVLRGGPLLALIDIMLIIIIIVPLLVIPGLLISS